MKKPNAVIQLIEELRGENIDSQVSTIGESKAQIFLTDEAAATEDGITLGRQDCELVFSSVDTLERFLEAIGNHTEASVTLFSVDVPHAVLDMLEKEFVAVDEG